MTTKQEVIDAITSLECFQDIAQAIVDTTDAEAVFRANDTECMNDVEDGESVIGVAHGSLARRMMAASYRAHLTHMQKELAVKAAASAEAKDKAQDEAGRAHTMEKVLVALFWLQVREDAGFWECNVGIRKGYTIVRPKGDGVTVSTTIEAVSMGPDGPKRLSLEDLPPSLKKLLGLE